MEFQYKRELNQHFTNWVLKNRPPVQANPDHRIIEPFYLVNMEIFDEKLGDKFLYEWGKEVLMKCPEFLTEVLWPYIHDFKKYHVIIPGCFMPVDRFFIIPKDSDEEMHLLSETDMRYVANIDNIGLTDRYVMENWITNRKNARQKLLESTRTTATTNDDIKT